MAAAARRDPRIIVFILRVVDPMSEQVEECLGKPSRANCAVFLNIV